MDMADMFCASFNGNLMSKMDKILGKAVLIKPVIDKLKIVSIIEKETMDVIVNPKTGEKEEPINHKKVSNGVAGAILILNRLISPKPMYEIGKWVDEFTCIGDIYGIPQNCMNDDRIADILDAINPHINQIWNQIVSEAIAEYNIPFQIIFNDITSTYFEGIYSESDLIELGYSRDQKPDKKQINIDINSNSKGTPLSYKILNGKTADKATVINNMEDIINTLKQTSLTNFRPLVVGDRAMLNDKIAIAYHLRDDIDFLGTVQLTNAMKKMIVSIEDDEYKMINAIKGNGLYKGCMRKWTFSYDGKSFVDNILIVHSERKLLDDGKRRANQIKTFIDVLEDLKGKLNKTIYKKLPQVEKRLESLGKSNHGSKYIKTIVSQNESGDILLEYSIDENKINEDKLLDGKYIIATNRDNLSAEQMVEIYKNRDISEKDFELVKDTLELRPIFLHKDKRIESLILLIMCSLLIYSVLKLELIDAEIETSVTKTLNKFDNVVVSYYKFIDGSVATIVGDFSKEQSQIFGKVKMPFPDSYVNKSTLNRLD
jgi:transposase